MSNELIKVIAVIVVSAVLVTVLRSKSGEYSFVLIIAVVCIVLVTISGNLFNAIDRLKDLFTKSGNAGVYFVTALKALGISYIVAFAADMCRDFGMSALAQTAETCGKVTIFILSLPLMNALLEAALKFTEL